MQRMRTLIAMAVIICVGIGSFYMYSAASASSLPQYYLKKMAGSDQEVKNVTLSGSFLKAGVPDNVSVSAKGSTYDSNLSFMERFNKLYLAGDGLDDYRKKYRNFMRAKENPSSFYEDSASLYYAGMNYQVTNHGLRNFSFEIAELNKKNNDTVSFQLPVPEAANYNMINVCDVQKAGRDLDVFTMNFKNGDGAGTEIHRYQFDVGSEKIISDQTVFSAPVNYSINLFTPTDDMKPSNYFIFSKTLETEDAGKKEFYAYNYAANQLQKLSLPNSVLSSTDYYCNGPKLYFLAVEDSGLKVFSYNIEEKKIAQQFTIPFAEKAKDSNTSMMVKNNRVYFLFTNSGKHPSTYLWAAGADDGKVLYKGKVALKKTAKDNGSIQIQFVSVAGGNE